jgi:hypothetical protein
MSQVQFVQIPAKASSGRHDRRRTSVLPWKKGKIAWAILRKEARFERSYPVAVV